MFVLLVNTCSSAQTHSLFFVLLFAWDYVLSLDSLLFSVVSDSVLSRILIWVALIYPIYFASVVN